MSDKKPKWLIEVSKPLDEAVENLVKERAYVSKSEFIREVVRRELEAMGFKVREVAAE